MKKTALLLTLVLLQFLCFAQTTTTTNYPDPDFVDQPFWYDSKKSSLRSFEKAPRQSASRSVGLYGAEAVSYIDGNESPLQFTNSENLAIIIKVEKGVDPSDVIRFFKMKSKKNSREYVAASVSAWDGGSKSSEGGMNILEFKKIREGIFQIQFNYKLARGEYAFINSKSFYAFGIE